MMLVETFEKYFLVQIARTEKEKEIVYGIRYNVYCKEFAYEPIDHFPDERESDEYDDSSIHCLIIHRSSGIPAACIRLVPACTQAEGSPLPFEKYCGDSLDKNFVSQLDLDRRTMCEISRLAVDSRFRRRSSDVAKNYGNGGPEFTREELLTFQLIAVAAFLAAAVLTELSGRGNVFAMMEPFLPRLLRRSGIAFQRAGRDTNYHGMRAPYFISTPAAASKMKPELLSLYQQVKKHIERSCGMRS